MLLCLANIVVTNYFITAEWSGTACPCFVKAACKIEGLPCLDVGRSPIRYDTLIFFQDVAGATGKAFYGYPVKTKAELILQIFECSIHPAMRLTSLFEVTQDAYFEFVHLFCK
jgi:hypothetical protein